MSYGNGFLQKNGQNRKNRAEITKNGITKKKLFRIYRYSLYLWVL